MDIDSIFGMYWLMILVTGIGGLAIGLTLLKKTGIGIAVLSSAVVSGIGTYFSIQWFHENYGETMGGTIGWFFAIAIPMIVYPLYLAILWLMLWWVRKRWMDNR